MIVKFRKAGNTCYISHLDLQRLFGRAFRRSGIKISYSRGFNPHPVLSFASALSLGYASDAEYLDIALEEPVNQDEFLQTLNACLPQGIEAVQCRLVDAYPSLMSQIAMADYSVDIAKDRKSVIAPIIDGIMEKNEIVLERRGKKGVVSEDVRPMILTAQIEGDTLMMRLASGSKANLNPSLLLSYISKIAEMDEKELFLGICRKSLLTSDGKSLLEL